MGLKADIEQHLGEREAQIVQDLELFIRSQVFTPRTVKTLIGIMRESYQQGLEVINSGAGTDFSRYSMLNKLKEIETKYGA